MEPRTTAAEMQACPGNANCLRIYLVAPFNQDQILRGVDFADATPAKHGCECYPRIRQRAATAEHPHVDIIMIGGQSFDRPFATLAVSRHDAAPKVQSRCAYNASQTAAGLSRAFSFQQYRGSAPQFPTCGRNSRTSMGRQFRTVRTNGVSVAVSVAAGFRAARNALNLWEYLVGVAGFEPATPSSRTR
jgi:hypothetical protein